MAENRDAFITIVGADANNLRDVDVQFPVGSISMVVGVSGSGKSSLLEDTLAREGAERLKSFLGVSQRSGEVEGHAFIGRLPATIHVGQRAFRASSRTTVGTASGLLSLLRRMFVRWSQPESGLTKKAVARPTASSYEAWVRGHHVGKVKVWAIPVSMQATDGVRMADKLRSLGVTEVVVRSETDGPEQWQRGRRVALAKFKPLNGSVRHLIEAEIGEVPGMNAPRLAAIVQTAFEAGEGRVFIELPGNENPRLAGPDGPGLDSRRHWVDPDDPAIYAAPDDHLLSFNAPEHRESGACEVCRGLGRVTSLDTSALVIAPERSMHEGAFALWTKKNYKHVNIQHETIEGLRGVQGFDPDIPWMKLSPEAKQVVIEGSGAEKVVDREVGTGRKMSSPRHFEGFRSAVLRRVERSPKTAVQLAFLIGEGPCAACGGSRWSAAARALKLGGRAIDELLRLDFVELESEVAVGSPLRRALPSQATPFFDQVHRLASSFVGAGLGHLSAERGLLEVSEGESRRLRLAAVFDGRHHGLCLLLDEPARGLHDQDVERLAATLGSLRGTHTLVLNEHRRRLAAAADQLVELGPGPGTHGGRVTYAGPVPKSWWKTDTGGIGRELLAVDDKRKPLRIEGVRVNNVQGVDVEVPLGRLVCVTGVSGSGKSSFVRGALVPAVLATLDITSGEFELRRGQWKKVVGAKPIRGLVALDQRAPATNRRSTVATFLGLAEPVRKYYATLPAAKSTGLKATDFGFNAGAGRCPECHGIGEIEEHGRWVVCPDCGGARLGPVALSVRDEIGNLSELFDLPIAQLVDAPSRALESGGALLQTIMALGVGHLSLGRRLDTVSGGELQRLRIGRELATNDEGGLLFVLDEPAAGLHREDVVRLVAALDKIVGQGRNSVVVVEHNLDVVAAADWVIEFGPGGGPAGGFVVAAGPPSRIHETDTATGRMMRTSGAPMKMGKRKPSVQGPEATSDQAAQVVRWLRRLLGDDIPPQPSSEDQRSLCPTIALSTPSLAGLGVLDFGGLGRELVALLIDLEASRTPSAEELAKVWLGDPEATLYIHPLVHDLYTWGARIPQTVRAERKRALTALGFDWYDHDQAAEVRATSARFQLPVEATEHTRLAAVQEAMTLGSGYVELRRGSHPLATAEVRLVDLGRGIVGPMKHSTLDFLDHDLRGQCRTCKGRGSVVRYPSKLIFGDRSQAINDLTFLSSEAAAVLKGVHRSVIVPFFKRMTKEGLWPASTAVKALGAWEIEVLEQGYWHRPGHGSFLKTPKSDPDEVASWLRWDGLHESIRENSVRGSAEWRAALTAGMQRIECPTCTGSGRRPHAELLSLGEQSYAAWLRTGTLGQLHDAIQSLSPSTERARQRQARLVECLGTVAGKRGSMRASSLRAPIAEATGLARAIAAAYTDMPVIEVP